VETEVHHDPQYENDQETVGTPIPLHYSLIAIVGCAVILGELESNAALYLLLSYVGQSVHMLVVIVVLLWILVSQYN
jgi:hypothetical protein